jgi:hypothetical protein
MEWRNAMQSALCGGLVQLCVDIQLPLEVLLTKIQRILKELKFRWLHPNNVSVLARRADTKADSAIGAKRSIS